jgi:hypothetical protein
MVDQVPCVPFEKKSSHNNCHSVPCHRRTLSRVAWNCSIHRCQDAYRKTQCYQNQTGCWPGKVPGQWFLGRIVESTSPTDGFLINYIFIKQQNCIYR